MSSGTGGSRVARWGYIAALVRPGGVWPARMPDRLAAGASGPGRPTSGAARGRLSPMSLAVSPVASVSWPRRNAVMLSVVLRRCEFGRLA